MWRQKYSNLKEFIAEHKEIAISENIVAIPEKVRPIFYNLFDEVRRFYLQENFSNIIAEARLLSDNFTKTENMLMKLLKLKQISVSIFLREFIQDPEKALMKKLFDPLFDLLKGKMNFETFEEQVLEDISIFFKKFYSLGYILWVELSLAKLLKPDRIFCVNLPEVKITKKLQQFIEDVPFPMETDRLSLEHDPQPTFTVPDFIIHSANRYVAIRSEYKDATWIASNASETREWLPLTPNLNPDLLVYVDKRLEDVALIADGEKVCRPDFVIECAAKKDWIYEAIERAKLHNKTLKPNFGTLIISRDEIERNAIQDFNVLPVGFNQRRLQKVISKDILTCL